ncbi:MAG: sensor domain-containing protein [Bifidobacteriaceae bacterium]|jgi:signal transduction histidine kinase|nr:sensor domain-containing protein [Bifidobacteriaceae bacterium]
MDTRTPRERGFVAAAMRDSAYLLLSWPLALVTFVIAATGIATGVGLAIMWVGIPIGAATMSMVHGLANAERALLRWRGSDIPRLPPAPQREWDARRKVLRWLRGQWSNPGRWREVAWSFLGLVVSCFTWSVAVVWWSAAVGGLTEWLVRIWLPAGADNQGLADLLGLWWLPNEVFDFGLGVFFAVTLPAVVRGLASAQAALAKSLLAPTRRALESRVEQLSRSRAQASAAEAQSLRKLERDIHDGPQQRLIRLGMDLSTAQRRIADGDSTAASAVLAEARVMTDAAIAELRALSRGIAPPILAQRGLVAALASVCAASPVPTGLFPEVDDAARFPAASETCVYFVVAEALANAAKHAGAAQASVTLRLEPGPGSGPDQAPGKLIAQVTDDGRGGAVIVPGHGLAGLADRAAGVDGSVRVDTVEGRGTTVTIEVPCA